MGRPFYQGRYKTFRETIKKWKEGQNPTPLEGPLEVHVLAEPTRPKTTKLAFPKGDGDNFAKAIFDALNKFLYDDDNQIVAMHIYKQWAEPGKPGAWYLIVEPVRRLDALRERLRRLFRSG